MAQQTPRCADCGTVYCCYRESVGEWCCSDCWSERDDDDHGGWTPVPGSP